MSHAALQRFIDRIRQQVRARAKVVSIPLDEAQDIANSLALLLLRENELLEQLNESQKVTEMTINGGSFK
jgi:hypothetical protein